MTLESVLIGLLSLYVLIPRLRILPKRRSVWISTYSVGIVSLISCETGSTGITLCDLSRKWWTSTWRVKGEDRWDIRVILVVCWSYSMPNMRRGTSIGTRAYPGDEGGLPTSPKYYIMCNHRSSSIPNDDWLPANTLCSLVWLSRYVDYNHLTKGKNPL